MGVIIEQLGPTKQKINDKDLKYNQTGRNKIKLWTLNAFVSYEEGDIIKELRIPTIMILKIFI